MREGRGRYRHAAARAAWCGAVLAAAASPAQDRAPLIGHRPLLVAVRGRPAVIRATVSDDLGRVGSVTLYVASSEDAAPFAVPMEPAAAGVYVATVPDAIVAEVTTLRYYVEALDAAGHATETRWYEVRVSDPAGAPGAPPEAAARPRPGWVTPVLIGVGAAAVAGGAVLAADGGGGGSGGAAAAVEAGSYAGTVNEVFSLPGAAPAVRSGPVTFFVTKGGTVTTDDLRPGSTLRAGVSGSNFLLQAPVNENGYTGQARYLGNFVQDRIVGTIDGRASSNGVTGAYSGSFTAFRE